MELWRMMLDGRLGEERRSSRIKTDIKHRDPAIRDWAAFRIVTTPHPIVGDRYRVWPLLDFESAVEDHLQQVTHILRGKDLMDSETRQRYLYQHMGWTYPRVVHWGRIKIHQFGSFSTSKLRKAIEAGGYTDGTTPPANREGGPPEGLQPMPFASLWLSLWRDRHIHQHGYHIWENRKLLTRSRPAVLRLGSGGDFDRRRVPTGWKRRRIHDQAGVRSLQPETGYSSAGLIPRRSSGDRLRLGDGNVRSSDPKRPGYRPRSGYGQKAPAHNPLGSTR